MGFSKEDILVSKDKYIFRVQGRAKKPQEMYFDSQGIVYNGEDCREATEAERSHFKEMEQEYGAIAAISL